MSNQTLKSKEIIFLNGKFIPREEAKLAALAPGFLYGWGLFETMRCYNKNIVYFDAHIKRLKKSCALIDMEFPFALNKMKEVIRETVKINGLPDAYVRLSLWKAVRGTDTLVVVKKYQPPPIKKYKEGFRACVSRRKQNENSFLARLKTSNYLFYRLAYAEAKNKDFDEAIILNNRGYIAEGSRSNIFLVKDKELFTPSLKCGCLDGISRKVVWDLAKKYNIKTYEGNFSVQDLCASDEAFFTNSLMGIMPLASVEKRKIGKGVRFYKLTRFFMGEYKFLLRRCKR